MEADEGEELNKHEGAGDVTPGWEGEQQHVHHRGPLLGASLPVSILSDFLLVESFGILELLNFVVCEMFSSCKTPNYSGRRGRRVGTLQQSIIHIAKKPSGWILLVGLVS